MSDSERVSHGSGRVYQAVNDHEKLRGKSEQLRPLLEMDCSNEDRDDLEAGEFMLRMTPDNSPGQQFMRKLEMCNILEVPRKVKEGGSYRKVYRWWPEAVEEVQAYLDDIPTLPCGCRGHIPAARGNAPDGQLRCKFCQAVHDRERFKEAVS